MTADRLDHPAVASPARREGVWYLGPVPLRGYALCIILGIVAAIWIGERRWVARGGRPGEVSDLAIWAVPFGLVGGRLYHVVTDCAALLRRRTATRSPRSTSGAAASGSGARSRSARVGVVIGARRKGIKLLPVARRAGARRAGRAGASAGGATGSTRSSSAGPTDLPWALEIDPAHRPDGLRRRRDLPPDVPLRVPLEPGGVRGRRLGRPPVPARPRPGGRALRHGLHAGRGWIETLRIDDVQLNDVLGLRLNVWTSIVLFVARRGVLRRGPRGVRPGREESVRPRDDAPEADRASEPAEPGAGPRRRVIALGQLRSGQRRPLHAATCTAAHPRCLGGDRRRRRENAQCRLHAFPPPQGLYDPRHEHDACGVAFVATLTGEAEPRHRGQGAHRAAQPRPPRRRRRRAQLRRRRRHPDAGPRRVPPRPSSTSTCPPAGRTPSAPRSCPGDDEEVAKTRAPDRGARRRGGPRGPRLARRPDRARRARRDRPQRDADLQPALRRRRRRPRRRHGAGAAGVLPAQAGRARDRRLLPVALVAHPRLQGHAHHRPARPLLPRPGRRADRLGARRRALAVLHQHVPELAAGPPVPVHRPQRRDQHRHGQPQLDAGPRGAARLRPDPRRPRAALPDLHARARPTRPRSTRCSSCSTSAAGRCRTRC